MTSWIDVVLLSFLVITALAIVRLRNLFAVAMLSGIYSLLSAVLFVQLDAVDVAFTEAAVGAGVSTVLMLATLARTPREEKPLSHAPWLPLTVVIITGGVLAFAGSDLPHVGDPQAPVHQHVAPRYLERSAHEVGVPNVVTSVLASYRGFDTLGEVTVVFTAGVGVVMLLGYGGLGRRRQERQRQREQERRDAG